MTPKIHEAIIYAGKRHDGQKRKSTDIPYIVHPMEVMEILTECGCTEEVVIAGILHDVIEDTCNDDDAVREKVRAEIQEKFGKEVLEIVNCESEDKSKTWKERKAHTIESLKNESREVQMVCCADKLSNIRSIEFDMKEQGEKVWERFNAGKKDLEWYYRGVADNLSKLDGMKMVSDLKKIIEEVFK